MNNICCVRDDLRQRTSLYSNKIHVAFNSSNGDEILSQTISSDKNIRSQVSLKASIFSELPLQTISSGPIETLATVRCNT